MAGQPILCNGGNLCFRKEAYERVRAARTDMHITSGDDVFLFSASGTPTVRILGV
jgi:hypothetical protein